jgi:Spy/CpxP family protein refolding chaperone
MKKTTFIFLGIALISASLLASSALAQGYGRGRGMGGRGCGMGPGTCWLFDVPNLTEEQLAKMTDLQKGFIKETSKLRSELAVKRIELNQLLAKARPTKEAVMAKQKEFTPLQSELQQKCLSNQLEIRKILSEEQLSHIPYMPGSYANPFSNYSQGQMRGYGPPQGLGYGPGRGRAWGNRWGCRQGWW